MQGTGDTSTLERELHDSFPAFHRRYRRPFMDPVFFTHMSILLQNLNHCERYFTLQKARVIQGKISQAYREDSTPGHSRFWKAVASALLRRYPPNTETVNINTETALSVNHQVLSFLLIYVELSKKNTGPTQEYIRLAFPELEEGERSAFSTLWNRFHEATPLRNVQTCHRFSTLLLDQEESVVPLPKEGWLDIVFSKDGELSESDFSRVSAMPLCHFAQMSKVKDAFVGLALHERASAFNNITQSLEACFKKGLFDSVCNKIFFALENSLINIGLESSTDQAFQLRCHLGMGLLQYYLTPPGLRQIKDRLQEALRDIRDATDRTTQQLLYLNKSFFMIYGEESLKLLLEAHLARMKDHLFPRYRRAQLASACLFGTAGLATLALTIDFIVEQNAPVAIFSDGPYAPNDSYALSAGLLNLAFTSGYAGLHAVGSVSETRLLQRMRRALDMPLNCRERFVHNKLNFAGVSASALLLLGLNIRSTLYFAMGGGHSETEESDSAKAWAAFLLFTLANLLLVLLGPWAVQLYRDEKKKEAYLSTYAVEGAAGSDLENPMSVALLARQGVPGEILTGTPEDLIEQIATEVISSEGFEAPPQPFYTAPRTRVPFELTSGK